MQTKEVTIQGVIASINLPYAEGHTINEAEARALNQTRAENIGNNLRKTIKELLDVEGATAESVQAAVQKLVSAYDAEYVLTVAATGGTKLDPLTKECRAVAREFLTGKLREQGMTQKAYDEKNGEGAFMAKVIEVSEMDQVNALAKKRIKERAAMADIGL